jgi:hypothetical protein
MEEETQNINYFKDQQERALDEDSGSNKTTSSSSSSVPIPPTTRHVYVNVNRYSIACTTVAIIIAILIYLIPYFLFKQNIITEGIFIFIVLIIIFTSIILIYLICNYENSLFISNNLIR